MHRVVFTFPFLDKFTAHWMPGYYRKQQVINYRHYFVLPRQETGLKG